MGSLFNIGPVAVLAVDISLDLDLGKVDIVEGNRVDKVHAETGNEDVDAASLAEIVGPILGVELILAVNGVGSSRRLHNDLLRSSLGGNHVGLVAFGAVAFAEGRIVELEVLDGKLDGTAVAAALVGLGFGAHC